MTRIRREITAARPFYSPRRELSYVVLVGGRVYPTPSEVKVAKAINQLADQASAVDSANLTVLLLLLAISVTCTCKALPVKHYQDTEQHVDCPHT